MEKKISVFWLIIALIIAIVLTFMSTFVLCSGIGLKNIAEKYSSAASDDYYILEKVKDYYEKYYIGSGTVAGSDIEYDEAFTVSDLVNSYIASVGDKYGQYFTKEEYEEYIEENSGSYCGVGITVQLNDDIEYKVDKYDLSENAKTGRGGLIVVSVAEDSPAYGSVLVGDIIIRVEGVAYSKLGYDETVNRIKGEPDTSVSFSVIRNAVYKKCDSCEGVYLDTENAFETDVSVIRSKVNKNTVYYSMADSLIDGASEKTAYIKITEFDSQTPEEFAIALVKCIDDGAESFIFDLRGNPGGELTSVMEVLSTVLDYDERNEKKALIRVEDKDKNVNEDYFERSVEYMDYYDIDESDEGKFSSSRPYKNIAEEYKNKAEEKRKAAEKLSGEEAEKALEKAEIYERLSEFEFSVRTDSKISVIVNSSTASAGELFTETLRDYGVSNTIGVTTYGKGSMQSFVYLSGRDTSMGVLKISANSYTSAYSESYNGIGIVPDYKIELDGKAALTSLWLLSKKEDAQFITAYNLLNPDGKLDMPDESEYIIND